MQIVLSLGQLPFEKYNFHLAHHSWRYLSFLRILQAVSNFHDIFGSTKSTSEVFLHILKQLLIRCISCLFSAWNFQDYLKRPTTFDSYLKSGLKPPVEINVNNVDLTFNETFTFRWTFSGLNVNVSQCSIESVGLAVRLIVWSNDTEQIQQNAIITIHNSSFGNLDLKPGTKAQITDCYIDGEFKDRPTLMIANNANVLIQNCHFKYFINESGSTILFGHSNSHVTIENSVFIQHNSSKGVLLLQYNSSMHISSSMISQNVATFLGYSAIPLHHGIRAVVDHTVLTNNSALLGGAMYVNNKCQVALTNCTFNSTKFQSNSYYTMSNNTNFTKNLDRIVSFHGGETFPGTISETQYASGNIAWNEFYRLTNPGSFSIVIVFSLRKITK